MNDLKQRREVSEYSLLLHAQGFVANHDGNVSLRSRDGFLITPTAVSKRVCTPDTIVACNAAGKPTSRGRPPSEVALHVGAYAAREDAKAIIHAHPPHASAFALAEVPLGPVTMPEVFVSIGEHIPLVPRFLPKDPAAAGAVGAAFAHADVLLLAGNGVIAVGPDLETAYLRVELVEHFARIVSIARGGVGAPPPLADDERAYLTELRKKAGLHRGSPAPASTAASVSTAASGVDAVRAVVEQEVRRALAGEKS
ncbi:MAG: class II aldolase/adducin family protein [Deltaproteobacteria bacterium]